MTKTKFLELLNTFVDPGDSIDKDASRIVFSIGGISYFLYLKQEHGDLLVSESEEEGYISANSWIINNLAHLELLAQRLIDQLVEPINFISPSIVKNEGDKEEERTTGQVIEDLQKYVEERSGALQTSVLYLVSNAGEGKSTILTKLAIEQARKYKNKETDWLLVPIELGGRTFLRFDDIAIGVLQNKYRFQYLYYNSFIELVKLGVLVPAFDGFEEMFVERSSKEAFSAMSSLVKSLDSVGTMIVAARKAFFDFENERIIENIISPIQSKDIVFDKFVIEKWTKEQFVKFASMNKVPQPTRLYEKVLSSLSNNDTHPILTRPVFVKKLFDLCKNDEGQDDFVATIRSANTHFLRAFIESIISREIFEKWIDRSGIDEAQTPLLSVEEHFKLLSLVAITMWDTQKESLDINALNFVANYYSELARKSAPQALQIVRRLPSHALIIKRSVGAESNQQYAFEHESFWMFFLGYAIYQQIDDYSKDINLFLNLRNTLRQRRIPIDVIHSVVDFVNERGAEYKRNIIELLVQFSAKDDKTSYTQDNSSDLIIRLLKDIDYQNKTICHLNFSVNSLQGRVLTNVIFEDCYFASTSVKNSKFSGCEFKNCVFDSLKFVVEENENKLEIINSQIIDCVIHSIQKDPDTLEWDPEIIRHHLAEMGLTPPLDEVIESTVQIEVDEKLLCLMRILRYFQRSTHISESVIQIKIGKQSQVFMEDTLPELIKRQVFLKIKNKGSNNQERYKLGIPIAEINSTIQKANGSYDIFLEKLPMSHE